MRVTPVVALLLVGSVVGTSAQSGPSLAPLTVPVDALPAGCALEPMADPAEATMSGGSLRLWPGTGPVFPANPWVGTDARLATTVRLGIDPMPMPRPDGQIVALSTASTSQTRDEDVREAYRAVYVGADGARTFVAAVRFGDASSVRPERVSAMTNPPRGLSRRFVRDATVARVTAAAPDACTRAIVAHVQSVM